MVFILSAFAGGVYEAIYKSPSDGFLFNVQFYGWPLLLFAWLGISFYYNNSKRLRNFIRWLLLAMLVWVIVTHLNSATS